MRSSLPLTRIADLYNRYGFFWRLAISIALLGTALAVGGIEKVFALLTTAEFIPAAAGIMLLVICTPVLAWRWQQILAAMRSHIEWNTLSRILFASSFAAIALPSANGADIVRGVMLMRPNVLFGTVASSILVDRIYGLVSMAILALGGGGIYIASGRAAPVVTIVVAGSGALITMTVVLLALAPIFASWLTKRSPGGAKQRAIDTAIAIKAISSWALIFRCLAVSLLAQILTISSVMCAGLAVHASISAEDYFVVVPIVWLATVLPVTISGLGVREASFAVLFQAMGFSYRSGIAVGAVVSAISLAAAFLSGAAFLFPSKDTPASPGVIEKE